MDGSKLLRSSTSINTERKVKHGVHELRQSYAKEEEQGKGKGQEESKGCTKEEAVMWTTCI